MGKVITPIRVTNVFDPSKKEVVEAVVDTGATMLVLPLDVVNRLGLQKIRDANVRYAKGTLQRRPIYRAVSLEIQGRSGTFDVLAETAGTQPLLGQVVLEVLDLVVNPTRRTVMPNPESPDVPTVEIL